MDGPREALLEALADLNAQDRLSAERSLRVFGPKQCLQYVQHLKRLRNGPQWCVFVDSRGARYFTRFKKLDQRVKRLLDGRLIPKFIVNVKSEGILF